MKQNNNHNQRFIVTILYLLLFPGISFLSTQYCTACVKFILSRHCFTSTAHILHIIKCFSTMDHVLAEYQAVKHFTIKLTSSFTRAKLSILQFSLAVSLLSLLSLSFITVGFCIYVHLEHF